MMNYVKIPHLPQSRVGDIIIGERYRQKLETPLKALGINALWLPPVCGVDERLSGHVDLAAIHLGGKRLVMDEKTAGKSEKLVNFLTNRGMEIIAADKPLGERYPHDAALNVCIIGNALYHKLAITDGAVLRSFSGEQISIAQGYAKCSICVVTQSAVITSDPGAAEVMKKRGLDVLLIAPGHIELGGFDTGFIGGSSFFVSGNELAFTGRLDGHPSKDAIIAFLSKHNKTPLFLTDGPIFDIGSAIPLTELADEK